MESKVVGTMEDACKAIRTSLNNTGKRPGKKAKRGGA